MTSIGSTSPVPDSVHYTEYGIPIRNLWHMCLYAWNDVSIQRHWSMDIAEDAPTLDGIDLIELKLDLIRRQQVNRNDGDYRLMLAICELILMRKMPSDQEGQYRLPELEREALVLHNIYERFVANFYRIHLLGWKVSAQKQLDWHAKSQNRFMPSLRPDIVMEEVKTGRVIILDTKFTAQSLVENQWGSQTFDSSHLYQLYAYLRTQENVSENHKSAVGILLYPAINKNKLSEKIELEHHIIRVESVDLSRLWQDVEQELLYVILKK